MLFGQTFAFVPECTEFVQLVYNCNHGLCVSTVGCKKGEVNVLYDTVPLKVKRQIVILTSLLLISCVNHLKVQRSCIEQYNF